MPWGRFLIICKTKRVQRLLNDKASAQDKVQFCFKRAGRLDSNKTIRIFEKVRSGFEKRLRKNYIRTLKFFFPVSLSLSDLTFATKS